MKSVRLPLLLLVVVGGLLLAGCASPAGLQPATTTSQPPASPTPLIPTSVPTDISSSPQATLPPTAAPTGANTPAAFQSSTYRDDVAGIELDYPQGWTVVQVAGNSQKQSIAYTTTIMSWKPAPGGSQGIPQGGTKLDLTVRDSMNGALQDLVAARKQELAGEPQPPNVLSEDSWTLANGVPAVRLGLDSPSIGRFAELITFLNGKMILLDGYGDLGLFDSIAKTLRQAAPPATQGALPIDAPWVFVNGRVVAVAPGSPSVDLREPGKASSGPGQTTVAPDGSAMLYFRFNNNVPQNQQLFVLDTRTGQSRLIVEGYTIWGPRFSPDGKSVAYTAITSPNYDEAKWELTVRDLAGGQPRLLASGDRQSSQGVLTPLVPVDWNKNGLLVEKIIYASDAPPQGLYRVAPTADSGLQPIYEKPYVRAVVSPDATRAVLVQGQIQMGEGQPKLALNLLDLASGKVKPIVPETNIALTSVKWSPDSRKILFTTQDSTGQATELRIINSDGSNEQRLGLQVQYALRDVAWRDSGTLLFLFVDPLNTLHVSTSPLANLSLQSLVEIGRVPGSDPNYPGDQFIYVPR